MELVVLGSGTGVPSRRRGAAGYVVQMGGGPLLFDCGPGTVTRLVSNHIDPTAIDRVFLSHLHPDHCADVIALVFANSWTPGFRRERSLVVTGPAGTALWLERLFEAFPGLRPKTWQAVVEEWVEGRAEWDECVVTSAAVVHGDTPALGYRITDGERTLVYSGDTGETPEIVRLATGADSLLIECSFPDEVQAVSGHLGPSAVGRIATEAGVARVILTHQYPYCEGVDIAGQCGSVYSGEIVRAEDGMHLLV